ncbi:MAG: ImmA/IrrE family metallo-endopeptidase [Planctomycetes bacterium]|nr:ImmA/IrrE family metallo-endopeptidase [Planctomycetota bacterium]
MLNAVDVHEICDQHNIDVQEIELGECAGFISCTSDKWVISVNKGDPLVRRRFTIAHELGHFFLHLSRGSVRIDRPLHRSINASNSAQEREANAFAAALLMPANVLQAAVNEGKPTNVLARELLVSASALSWRLQDLGLKK